MSVLIELLRKESNGGMDEEALELLYETYVKHKSQYKLRALEEDNDFFHSYILGSTNGKDYIRTPAQRRLHEAKSFFKKNLKKLSFSTLSEMKTKIDENSRVLVYSVKDTADATLIFETTNDRGKGLTNLEKIKSFMMYKSYVASDENPDQLLKTIRTRFSDIYKEYEKYETRIDEDSVLQYHYIGHEAWGSKEYQQYVSRTKGNVNKYISKGEDEKALAYIDEYTKSLKETFFVVHEIIKSQNEHLRDLFILGRTGNVWPLLIKTYKRDSAENKGSFYRIVRLLETYSFRVYAVKQSRANTGQPKLFALARDFEGDFKDLEAKLRAVTKSYSTSKGFKGDLADEEVYEWMSNRDLSYFFWKYENHLRLNKQPKSSAMSESEFVSKSSKYKLTIEHVASQNPKKSIVKDDKILPEVTDEFKESYLHCIGNLTIDPKSSNSSKGNKPFDGKNEKYFRKAPFKTQNELEDYVEKGKWSVESILKRKATLIDFALNYWAI